MTNTSTTAQLGSGQPSSAVSEVLDFLNSIEGAGYGGMASFEIARSHVQDMLNGAARAQASAGIAPESLHRIVDFVGRVDRCRDNRPLVHAMRNDEPLTVGDLRAAALALAQASREKTLEDALKLARDYMDVSLGSPSWNGPNPYPIIDAALGGKS